MLAASGCENGGTRRVVNWTSEGRYSGSSRGQANKRQVRGGFLGKTRRHVTNVPP